MTGSPQLPAGPGSEWKTNSYTDPGFTEYSEYRTAVILRKLDLKPNS